MKTNSSIDIERAIETVRLFAQPNDVQGMPTLEHFDVHDGKLQQQHRSALEKTLAFTKDCLVRTFSSGLRKKQQQKHKAIKGTLQESLDLLKVYSSALVHMQKGSDGDRVLAERVLHAASSYNDLVRQAKRAPSNYSRKIKHFFLKMAGWEVAEELLQDEIHIPKTQEYSSLTPEKSVDSLASHKFTFQRESTSQKMRSVLQSVQRHTETEISLPKQQELDVFRAKAISLLLNQDSLQYSLEDVLQLVHTNPIEFTLHEGAYLLNDCVIQLRQMICDFPGIDIEIKGAFQRDRFFPDLVIPIKDSFQLNSYIFQSGFPHPLQYTGMALHEKLLPSCLLRPHMCPNLEQLFDTKRLLARELLPDGSLYHKAKRLLEKRKMIFRHNERILALQNQSVMAHIVAAGLKEREVINKFFQGIAQNDNWYEELSIASVIFHERVSAKPIDSLQEEWLLKNNPEIHAVAPQQAFQFCQTLMLQSIEQAKRDLGEPFSPEIIEAIGIAASRLHLLQLSEHLNFAPYELTVFERKLMTWLFRQQLIFAYELYEVDIQDLEQHLLHVIQEDIALFEGTSSNDRHTRHARELVEEMIQYYNVRAETR